MLKILVADDHAIVREGLKQILSESVDMMVAGEAASGGQVLEMSRQKRWDMILLDITMPGGNGLETLKQLKKEKPHLPVLMLSMHPEEQYDQGKCAPGTCQGHSQGGQGRALY